MIDSAFTNALNDCINRLNSGETVADCLRRYPQHAERLAPLLESGMQVRRAQADSTEATRARERQSGRFERSLNLPRQRQRSIVPALARWAASIALILVLLAGGTTLLAENALPGDALYPVKLWTESARMMLSAGDSGVEAMFTARRLDEARQLITLRRSATTTLTGVVTAVGIDTIRIEDVPVRVTDEVIPVGSRVEVEVRAAGGQLTARQIRILQPPDALRPSTTPDPPPTRRPAASATRVAPTLPAPTRQPPTESRPAEPSQPPPERPNPEPTQTRGRGG